MFNGLFHIREPKNESVKGYEPVSEARAGLKTELRSMLRNPVEVPCIIGGKEIHSGDLVEMNPPHSLKQSLGYYHRASVSQAEMAIGFLYFRLPHDDVLDELGNCRMLFTLGDDDTQYVLELQAYRTKKKS